MEYPALEKFMKSFKITYQMKVQRAYYSSGKPCCCVEIIVFHGGKIQYLQYHCYKLLRNKEVIYDEGNLEYPISSGILGHLSQDNKVDAYFEDKARKLATKYFNNNIDETRR